MPTQTFLIEHCLTDEYQIYCFDSAMLIICKIEEKFFDSHLPSCSTSQRNSEGTDGECTESMWRGYLIIWIVLCMSVVGKYLILRSFWTLQGAKGL